MITIHSKHNNFRRCGVAHQTTPTSYPDGHWSPAQLAILQAEPLLTVEVSGDPEQPGDKAPGDLTVKELTAKLESLLVTIPKEAKKAELLALYLQAIDHPEE